mgnify:CR=1 FL=1
MQVTHVPTSSTHVVSQGLLELLWTVYSEEECLQLRNTMHKKGLKFPKL